jgi:drug/metabolite transporter (DMT)-like permease
LSRTVIYLRIVWFILMAGLGYLVFTNQIGAWALIGASCVVLAVMIAENIAAEKARHPDLTTRYSR